MIGGQLVNQYGHVVITVCGDDPLNVSQDFLNFVAAAIDTKNVLTVTPVVQAPLIIRAYMQIEAGIAGTIFNPPTSAINDVSISTNTYFQALRIGESIYTSELDTILSAITNIQYVNIATTISTSAFSTSGLIKIPLIQNPDLTDASLILDNSTVLVSGDLSSYNDGNGNLQYIQNSLINNDQNVTLTYKPARIGDTVNLLVKTNQLLVLNQVIVTSVPV